jgi:hypothetical protein
VEELMDRQRGKIGPCCGPLSLPTGFLARLSLILVVLTILTVGAYTFPMSKDSTTMLNSLQGGKVLVYLFRTQAPFPAALLPYFSLSRILDKSENEIRSTLQHFPSAVAPQHRASISWLFSGPLQTVLTLQAPLFSQAPLLRGLMSLMWRSTLASRAL